MNFHSWEHHRVTKNDKESKSVMSKCSDKYQQRIHIYDCDLILYSSRSEFGALSRSVQVFQCKFGICQNA